MDTKFSTAVHILIFTSEHEGTVTSEALARSVGTNPSHIRKILTALKTAGLIHSSQGKKGIHLAQPKESITLDTIYRAVYPDKEILHIHPGNPQCPIGANIDGVLSPIFHQSEQSLLAQLHQQTLNSLINDMRALHANTES